MNKILTILLFLSFFSGWAQEGKYVVFFKDKAGTPHSIENPSTFLSAKSVARREKQNIAITDQDLPVDPSYVASLASIGAEALYTSRWFNCALVEVTDDKLPAIEAQAFVMSTTYVAPATGVSGGRIKKIKEKKESSADLENFVQLEMIGLDDLHEEGYDAAGITIGVFDSGFEGVDLTDAFVSLRDEDRIKDWFDFVGKGENVYQYDAHGSEVLSIMAAELDGSYRGGAYGANYLLYVTEDVASEFRVEEYNWLFAAERADSAGVDIINSSLGYNLFDDPAMNYEPSQMDGQTAVVTRAAAIALTKGIVVVVSAGNDGGNSWNIINPPADADGVLAVGAVASTGGLASFSSVGPSADGRIKPDVVAMGSSVSIVKSNGSLGVQSGTSEAAPLIASLAAGVWQAFPDLSAEEVYSLIINSGSLAQNPDNQRGYGLPHYVIIKSLLNVISAVDDEMGAADFLIYPNPAKDELIVEGNESFTAKAKIQVMDVMGRVSLDAEIAFESPNYSRAIDISRLSAGTYLLRVITADRTFQFRFMKK
ncbi:MAG: S8 family peptidase [Cyclobacteriaceae bacterium]